ncbi:hydroxysqualene dehydroxylase [Paenibacillus shenyangensis]|uniref:hydroxysqualene dehydroxylase n=1 Tax=Paenibacillus sp. A9 TaxID=1284352 RepID=UPI000364D24B|nr:FAD-dependent oxidoreductase [Paenibacillus sp. A9]
MIVLHTNQETSDQPTSDKPTIIIGSGLAGLSCAFELADQGKKVIVLEAAPYIGGRTANWNEHGMGVESGFHKFIGYYVALPELLERAGIVLDEIVHWETTTNIRHPEAEGTFGLDLLKAPLKTLAGALGNNDLLSPLDKASLAPFFAAGFKDYLANPEELDEIPVKEYAKKHGVTDKALERLIEPLSSGIFFLPIEQYSTYAFFGLFAPAIPRPHLIRIGAFKGGMTEVMTEPLSRAIEERGGQVMTGKPVAQLLVEEGAVTGVQLEDGTRMEAEQVVVATNVRRSQMLVGEHFSEQEWCRNFLALEIMPYVTAQFEATEKLAGADHTNFGPGTQLGSFSEQSRTTFQRPTGRASIILVDPDKLIDLPDEEVWELTRNSLHAVDLPNVDTMTQYRIIRGKENFYRLSAGNEKHRPQQVTPVPGLFLAGDYTKQPLLATMEGAVISGQRAARGVLKGHK